MNDPPFDALVWRFPHRCVLDCPSIELGLAVVATSHARHPSELFDALVWHFPHRCVLDGPSIEPGLAAMAASHARHPSELCLPSLLHSNALFA